MTDDDLVKRLADTQGLLDKAVVVLSKYVDLLCEALEDDDDLVKRLRERYFRKGYETEAEAKERRQKEREEAADRIKQLERERDDARAYAAEVRIREKRAEDVRIAAEAKLAEVEKERDYTEGTNEVLRGENQRLEATVATLQAQVEGGKKDE